MATLLFDVYGTLVDPAGMAEHLKADAGGQASRLAAVWRERQLEYTFRRALMGRYRDFSVCTAQALQHAAESLGVAIGETRRAELLEAYRKLPAFSEARPALEALRPDHDLHAFSNGTPEGVAELLEHAGLTDFFASVISVDAVASYKPDPKVYAHALVSAGSSGDKTWMISANGFDALGARNAGLHSIWVRRHRSVAPDPWEIQPTATVAGLAGIRAVLEA